MNNIEENNTDDDLLKVFIADLILYSGHDEDLDARMEELESLVETYGGMVIVKKIQKKLKPNYKTYLGTGKMDEIKMEMQATGASILILGNILKAQQVYNINELLRPIGAQVWDRVDLILKIFEAHAKSVESRLQIALAAIKHMGPRIVGMGLELSRQAGGIGTKGIGETNTEIMRRHLQERELRIKKKLDQYKKARALHRESRKKRNLETVGIVGYTNAGKSCLLNALTGKGVYEANELFATLGTSVGKMYVKTSEFEGKEILLNDTIGFIRDLPPSLIDAFSSTLEDSIESDILLHVVDASDKNIIDKIDIVNEILDNIKANQKKIYVFSKIDLISDLEIEVLKKEFKILDPIFISSTNKTGLEELKEKIVHEID